jgi:hypothetical protein
MIVEITEICGILRSFGRAVCLDCHSRSFRVIIHSPQYGSSQATDDVIHNYQAVEEHPSCFLDLLALCGACAVPDSFHSRDGR